MTRAIITMLAVALLAGCGGGGAAQAPGTSVTQPTSTGNGSSIESTITVPAATSAQSGSRSAQYISTSSLGLKVTVTDIPPTGQTASFTATTTVYPLGTGANHVVVPTPTSATGHSEDLTYVVYNAAPVSNAIPGSAKALAWGLTTGFVVAPGQNTNNITLSAVVDGFAPPLAETGAYGMMSATPPTRLGAVTSYGLGADTAPPPSGVATLLDAGGNNITTALGGPWATVGAVPTTATTAATGVPVTITEGAGTCGYINGTTGHAKLFYAGVQASTAALTSSDGALAIDYDGNGGAGWYATISAKGQTSTLTYTLSSLAVTGTNVDYNCANQTLAFSSNNEAPSLMTIVEHVPATPYTVTVPNDANCPNLVTVDIGSTATQIAYNTPTSLGGTTSTFTIKPVTTPTATAPCYIKIQDTYSGSTGGPNYPGGTTYLAVFPVGYTQSLTVPTPTPTP
jgi:hypothetical protein